MKAPHTRTHYLFLAAICGALIAGCIFTSLSDKTPKDAYTFYVQALQNAHVETQIFKDGQLYVIHNGEVRKNAELVAGTAAVPVLALAYAQTLAKRDPIFDLTGVDPKVLDPSIDQLKNDQIKLAQAQRSISDTKLAASLYPIDFLYSLVALEKSRQLFIKEGSDTNEEQYQRQLKAAATAGLSDIEAFSAGLYAALHQKNSMGSFNIPGLGGPISSGSMLGAAQSEAARMHEVSDAIDTQLQCTHGAVTYCHTNALALPRVAMVQPEKAPSPAQNQTMQEIRGIAQEIFFEPEEPTRIVALSSSNCFSTLPAPYYFLANPRNNGTAPTFFFIGDMFLQPITEQAKKQDFTSYFAKTYDVSYMFSNQSMFYICPEVGGDFARVQALGAIAAFAQSHPELEPALRASLVSGAPLMESSAVTYLRAILSREEATPDNNLDGVIILALEYNNRTAGLDKVVSKIATVNDNHIADVARGVPFDISAPDMYFTHSAMQSLYLANNPSAGLSNASSRSNDIGNTKLFFKNFKTYTDIRSSSSVETITQAVRAMYTFENP